MPPARRMRLLWIALFVAPIAVLAGIGIRAIHALGVAAREDARRECSMYLEQVAPVLEAALEAVRQQTPAPAVYNSTPRPTEGGKAQELYEQALAAPAAARAELLRALQTDFPDARLASGLPLQPLVKWAMLELQTDPAALIAWADALARCAVWEHPSLLTEELLSRTVDLLRAKGADASAAAARLEEWRSAETSRFVLESAGLASGRLDAPRWIAVDDERWLAEPAPGGEPRVIRRRAFSDAVTAVLQRIASDSSAYADTVLSLAGEPLYGRSDAGEALALLQRGDLQLTAALARPSVLYAKQRREALVIAALLVCAIGTATASYWTTERALVREQQLGEMKSNFVSSISHELRAPIASIRVMAENLSSGIVAGPRQNEYHRFMADECRRLSVMIENVLDLARIEQNRKRYHFDETDVRACLADAVALMQPRAGERRQTIAFDVETFDRAPVCDSLAIQRAVVNLLDNAIKFAPEETAIELTAAPSGPDHWSIAVADRGHGVPLAQRERVFERFYRIGSELRREAQGAGIGLSLVKHIAESHGGSALVEEAPGGGARFILLLPFLPPEAAGTDPL